MLDSWKIAVTRPAIKTVLLLFMTTIQPAFGEIEVVYESKEKTHGLCKISSITPTFKGLEDIAGERHINQIVSKYIEDKFNYYLQTFENDLFCEEGLGEKIHLEEVSHFLSKNLISIAITTISSGGMHPWYELKTYNFDPHSGNQYSLTALIPGETMEWLKRQIKQEIEKEQHQRVDDLDTGGKHFFEKYLVENVYISRKDDWRASEPSLAIAFDFNTVMFGHANGPTGAKISLYELALRLPKDNLLFKLAMEESE